MIVSTLDQLHDLTFRLRDERYVVVDTETNGLKPFHGTHLIGIAFYFPVSDVSYYVPFRHGEGWNAPLEWLDEIREAYGTLRNQTLIFFNAKFDIHILHNDNFPDPEKIEDVMLAAHLLNENEDLSNGKGHPQVLGWRPSKKGAYTLKRLSAKYLDENVDEWESTLNAAAAERGVDPKAEMYKLPAEVVAPYAEHDVVNTWRLRQFYWPGLERWGLVELFKRRNAFLVEAVVVMERNGLYINPETLQRHVDLQAPRVLTLQQEFENRALEMGLNNFNPGSWQQLLTFFRFLGHDLENTNKFTMEVLQEAGEEWADTLLLYRSLSKADGTYYSPYRDLVDSDNVLHANLNLIGTVSGRLSSDNPNLQQIPRTSTRYTVKELFEPREGYVLVEVDYSTLELRIATHIAQEETMRGMFNSGTDMHQYTADALGVERYRGKTANFSFLYGMGPKTGKLRLKTTEAEAKKIINGWHTLYPAFKIAYLSAQAKAEEHRNPKGDAGDFQYVRLADGRVRRFHEFNKYPYWDDKTQYKVRKPPPFYTAFNFIIQGTASGMVTETSLLRLARHFGNGDVRILLTIHDSIIFEIKPNVLAEALADIRQIMTDWDFNPGLDVEAKYSTTNWGDMKTWK